MPVIDASIIQNNAIVGGVQKFKIKLSENLTDATGGTATVGNLAAFLKAGIDGGYATIKSTVAGGQSMNGFMGYEIPSNQFELVKDAQWFGNEMSNGFGKHYGDLQCNYIKCKACVDTIR